MTSDETLDGATSDREDPIIGRLVDKRYRVTELLGEGGMGRVYLAEELQLRRPVALKMLSKVTTGELEVRRTRFLREARAASRIDHPGSITIYGFGEWAGTLYIAMEFLDGFTLGDLLAELPGQPQRRVAKILLQTSEVLQTAHEVGVLHRDLKPDNIMIVAAPDGGEQVKVVDFGLAILMTGEDQRLTREGIIVGTPHYMSPEQGRALEVDARSDVYALGVILYQALCGALPFPGRTATDIVLKHLYEEPPAPSDVAPERSIHPSLESLALWALAKAPEARPQTAYEFALELRAALELLEQGRVDPERQRKDPLSAGGRATRAAEAGLPTRPQGVSAPAPRRWDQASSDRVVVVEPATEAFASSLTAALRAQGVQTERTTAIGNAAQAAASSNAKLLVVDLRLDPTSALPELERAMTADLAGVPLIVVGPDDAMDLMTRSLELGVAEYVPNSVVTSKLARAVRRVIKRTRRKRG